MGSPRWTPYDISEGPMSTVARAYRHGYDYAMGRAEREYKERIKALEREVSSLRRAANKRATLNSTRGPDQIYFAHKQEWIKIGISNNPIRRMLDLRKVPHGPHPNGMMHAEVVLLHNYPGDLDEERRLHGMFSEHRVAGEWFADVPAIRDYISQIKEEA